MCQVYKRRGRTQASLVMHIFLGCIHGELMVLVTTRS